MNKFFSIPVRHRAGFAQGDPGSRPLLRLAAGATLVFFLAACSHTVQREPLETRTFRVAWDDLDSGHLAQGPLQVESVVLTPAQWPLEASVKHLLKLDFVGVVENLDLRFRSATLRGDMLRRLFERGLLPVYLKVSNPTVRSASFDPGRLAVRPEPEIVFRHVPAASIPGEFEEIDWAGTGVAVVSAALFVAVVALAIAGARDRGGVQMPKMPGRAPRVVKAPRFSAPPLGMAGDVVGDVAANVAVSAPLEIGPPTGEGGPRPPRPTTPGTAPRRDGLLRKMVLQPGETQEGFVFFRVSALVTDWREVRLAEP